MNPTRRNWLSACLAVAALPDVLAAHQHAHRASQNAGESFAALEPDTAVEIEAIAAQIIPSDDGPGAREAGVIYFIDRALSTFAQDRRDDYLRGMTEIQAARKQLFPDSTTIAALTHQQLISLIQSIEDSEFFHLLRFHTVLGYLGDPSYGGNRNRVGWHQIGFDDRMAWRQPFGYYDSEGTEQAK